MGVVRVLGLAAFVMSCTVHIDLGCQRAGDFCGEGLRCIQSGAVLECRSDDAGRSPGPDGGTEAGPIVADAGPIVADAGPAEVDAGALLGPCEDQSAVRTACSPSYDIDALLTQLCCSTGGGTGALDAGC